MGDSLQNDDVSWSTVQDEPGVDALFNGNVDNQNQVRNALPEPIATRHVKLTVVAYAGWAGLRWGVEGCPIILDN